MSERLADHGKCKKAQFRGQISECIFAIPAPRYFALFRIH